MENSTITIGNSNGKRMKILVDNLQNSVNDNVVTFNRLRSLNTSRVNGMKFFTNDSERFETAEKLLTANFLITA